MKILITGHRGFIGKNALEYFQPKHDVSTYEYDDGPFPGVMEYDWVMHFGAISSTTEKDVDKILRQNLDFSTRLFDDCKTFGVNLQYSSSASVYGLGTDFKETAPVDPRTPYAWSKYLFERYVREHQGGNIVQGFRYFNVYGHGEEHKGNQASPFCQFTQQAQSGIITVFEGSEKYHRDFVHVDRVLEVHDKFLDIRQSGIWNIGTGETRSFLDVAMEIGKKYPSVVKTKPMPSQLKSSYQEYTCADLTNLNNTLIKYGKETLEHN
jgi:ADP-L-glycero-D-manno-heptose 6-epimerase